MRKKIISMLLATVLLTGTISGCSLFGSGQMDRLGAACELRAAVLYSGGEGWKDTLYSLEQSPMLGLSPEAVQVDGDPELEAYDILYLDESLVEAAPEGFAEAVYAFTEAGGAVFLPNSFCTVFEKAFLGISEVKKLNGFCQNPRFPRHGKDVDALQQVLRDYAGLYVRYTDFSFLQEQDYGFGVIPDTAMTLASWDGTAVYTLNNYGDGYVFLTNPMLPSAYSTGSLTMEPGEGQSNFASTTASFNQLLLGGFAEFIAKQRNGYAMERVYGYFGTPSMSWELHYEEITGIANDSLQLFAQLCREYDQIPSYTLIRNSYTWFLRAEGVTFLLNQSEDGFEYQMDLYESAYSSGTHIDAGGEWLTLGQKEDGGSYFVDYPQYTLRSYPQAVDLNGDDLTDILCGSADGKIYFFEGTGFHEGRLHTRKPVLLTDRSGAPIQCGAYSAPQAADLDSDGAPDLICGWDDGKVRWFAGDGSLVFEEREVLADAGRACQVLPSVADADGDGTLDLLVGSNDGMLMLYPGMEASGAAELSALCAQAELGDWLAPTVTDWNRDGIPDLAVGVYHGYIAILPGNGDGSFRFDGYITADEMNYKGNHNLKFGNWAVPGFADLDGDGREDLLCGSLEYGVAYPIDSEYFPYREKLQAQLDYARDHDFYMGVHFYTNSYASAQRESYELSAHKKAMESYGVDVSRVGANQHTWYTSSLSGSQSMSNIAAAGLLWQSGFAAPGSRATAPQVAAENVVALPFFLMEDGDPTVLIQNNSILLYNGARDLKISARYGMPMCLYYHCDFVYESEGPAREALETAQDFREKYDYNFNREDQLIQASACALRQQVRVEETENGITICGIQPQADFALYDEAVNSSLGVRVVFSEKINARRVGVDADIWYRDGQTLVLGLNRPVTLTLGERQSAEPHLCRVNMAAELTMTEAGAEICFLSGGMMEASVKGEATTDSPGWKVTRRGDETVFVKYGSQQRLNLIFKED